MSEVDGRSRAVTWLGLVASVSLASPALGISEGRGVSGWTTESGPAFMLPFTAGSAILATVLGLLVMRRDRAAGWVWVLLAGSLVCAVMAVALIGADEVPDSWLLYCAAGAALMLISLGLLGAGNWLLHARGVAAATPVIAATFAVPLLAWFLAILLSRRDFSVIAAWVVGLGLAGLAAAIGILTMVPALRSGPAPAAPSQRIVVVGCVASALILGPDLVHRIVPDPKPVAITGLAVLAAAIALAALLGRPAFGAVLALSLLGYGLNFPIGYATFFSGRIEADLIVALAGAALGGLAAATRWRHRFAGAAGVLVAAGVLAWALNPAPEDVFADGSLPGALLWLLLAGSGFALTAGAVTAAATIGAGAMLPVALGLIVPAIGLGLTEADTLVNHGALADAGGGAQLLVTGLISSLALLAGAGLLVASHRQKPRADQQSEPGEPQPV
ncbi:MAG: hypothetical protein ACJ72N_10000 [Labedaea sp.]